MLSTSGVAYWPSGIPGQIPVGRHISGPMDRHFTGPVCVFTGPLCDPVKPVRGTGLEMEKEIDTVWAPASSSGQQHYSHGQ